MCAEIVLLPISATVFSRVTVAGLLLNFLAIPLMTVVRVAGLLAVGLSLFADGAARVCGYVAHLAASGIIETARLIDLAPWVSWRVAALGLVLSAAYYGGWIILITESLGGPFAREPASRSSPRPV